MLWIIVRKDQFKIMYNLKHCNILLGVIWFLTTSQVSWYRLSKFTFLNILTFFFWLGNILPGMMSSVSILNYLLKLIWLFSRNFLLKPNEQLLYILKDEWYSIFSQKSCIMMSMAFETLVWKKKLVAYICLISQHAKHVRFINFSTFMLFTHY